LFLGSGDFFVWIRMFRIWGFSGCDLKIVFGKWWFFCLNQDVQDLRIFRMWFKDCFWGSGDFFSLNQDIQDLRIFRMWFKDCFWGSGDFFVWIRMFRIWGFSGCDLKIVFGKWWFFVWIRMFRIWGFSGCDLKIVFEEVVIFLSESGCSGFEDLQDVI
jgi:hypothetical protein